ncbi:hypothetical protein EVAR_47305_1 [Eumeta japonica]|uniref:Uncharacterized protein n=1 Tax=Eumeta variegata TaxID=151549 RepID=A0A4C1YKV1_EUMVA|nr:hypothetical protein EVAR_47305_1 [Eumeta japonica]
MLNESLAAEDIKSVTSEQTEELVNYLYQHISEMSDEEDTSLRQTEGGSGLRVSGGRVDRVLVRIDSQVHYNGYTPLMLASKSALHQNVQLLLEKCPSTVNMGMKTSGNTALYLAVEGAGMEALERGDKSKISGDYLTTMECLLNHHADPALDNFSGCNVNTLLTEFNINPLSMFVARTMSSLRDIPEIKKIDELMFIREAMDEDDVSVVTYKSRNTKEHTEPRNMRTDVPSRIAGDRQTATQTKDRSDVLAKIAISSEGADHPMGVDSRRKATESSKPIILENKLVTPKKTAARSVSGPLSSKDASLIKLSPNSQLTVPKKTDILKRKVLDMADLEEKFKIKFLKKSI